MTNFCAYLLHEHQHGSYTYLESYQVEAPDKGLVKYLEQTALEHIKSRWKFRRMELSRAARLEIFRCSRPLQGESLEEKAIKAIGVADRGDLQSESFFLLSGDDSPEGKGSSDLIIVFRNLRFNFVIFENPSRFSFDIFGHGNVVASPDDSAQTIYDAARRVTTRSLQNEDPWTVATIDWFCLREVKAQYETDYRKALEGELVPSLVGRDRSSTRDAEEKIRDFETSSLIFLFTATREPREHSLRIPYVLFNRESGSYWFVHQDHIDASSEDTAGVIHDVILQYMDAPAYGGRARYFVHVYEPGEAFQSAYNKQPNEMKSLRLEDKAFSRDNCSMFLPRKKLSEWRVGQTLIIIFGIPVQPKPLTAPTCVADGLDYLDTLATLGRSLMTDTKCKNCEEFREDTEMTILGGPPIAPIPLLFQPFGYFRDIRRRVDVPGEGDINDGKLMEGVDELVDKMIGSHKSEEDRRSKFIAGLQGIFGVTPHTADISSVPGGEWISDGHVDGPRRAMVFCMVCKDEFSTTCEPTAQLVARITSSSKSRGDQHPELFKRWRVPVLGVTYVGHNVQFVGITWAGTVRVVPLTPPLSMMHLAGEEFRWDLFLAFKTARIVLAEIQDHVQNILQAFDGPDAGWPPVMTAERSCFPSITEIDIEAGAFPGTRSEKIKFILESRHDNVQDRWLYHARLVSPTPSDEGIYVKFSQRYSVELHRFCAERGLAPRILGFQELHGGWFVVAMEKVDTEDPNNITTFPEAVKWKKNIEELVSGFHQKGFVHGDLRMANFVFTKSDKPRRMILIDFDWGGKDGEVEFPHEKLIEGLGVSNNQLYGRKIKKEHDLKCFEKVVEWLDLAIEYESLRSSGN